MLTVVIDYELGNVGSILNMLQRIGAEARLSRSPEDLDAATHLILPGVGAFDQGVANLARCGLLAPLRQRVLQDGVPLLGICLGMQLLGCASEEGEAAGLGLIPAHTRRLDPAGGHGLRLPNMGWRTISVCRGDSLVANLEGESRFYFVHSYHVVCRDPAHVLATSEYGQPFAAVIRHRNIMGVQFHPEKSHRFGMQLLRNYLEAW